MRALQWNAEGDGAEAGVVAYTLGTEKRWGVPTKAGMVRLHTGDWIVFGDSVSDARVYSPTEFHHIFTIIEEGA
jgi:hypothetical protein